MALLRKQAALLQRHQAPLWGRENLLRRIAVNWGSSAGTECSLAEV